MLIGRKRRAARRGCSVACFLVGSFLYSTLRRVAVEFAGMSYPYPREDVPMHRLARFLVITLCWLPACRDASDAPAPESTPPAATPEAMSQPSARAPDADERAAMLEVLRGNASGEPVSLVVSPGVHEAGALAAVLESVFREAGWPVNTSALTGMVLKPAPLRLLVADESEPPVVDVVRRALAAGGLQSETGTGYRAFYDQKKRENPAWPGVPLDGQAFVIVIPPEAPSFP
jgi:hypothetical protein